MITDEDINVRQWTALRAMCNKTCSGPNCNKREYIDFNNLNSNFKFCQYCLKIWCADCSHLSRSMHTCGPQGNSFGDFLVKEATILPPDRREAYLNILRLKRCAVCKTKASEVLIR